MTKMEVSVKFFVLVSFLIVSRCSVDCSPEEKTSQEGFMSLIQKCMKMDDVGLCLKWKAATALDRLSRMKGPLPVTDYLLLVRTPKAQDAQDEGKNSKVFS